MIISAIFHIFTQSIARPEPRRYRVSAAAGGLVFSFEHQQHQQQQQFYDVSSSVHHYRVYLLH